MLNLSAVSTQYLPVRWQVIYKISKVKQSLYSPGQALRLPEGLVSQISKQSTHESGKVVSPAHRKPSRPRKYSWYSFLLEAELTPGS